MIRTAERTWEVSVRVGEPGFFALHQRFPPPPTQSSVTFTQADPKELGTCIHLFAFRSIQLPMWQPDCPFVHVCTNKTCVRKYQSPAQQRQHYHLLRLLRPVERLSSGLLSICTAVAIGIVAETCAPFTVLPALMNEYRPPSCQH